MRRFYFGCISFVSIMFMVGTLFARSTVIANQPLSSSGGGSGGNITFVSSGVYRNTTSGTTLIFGFPSLPTSGNGVIFGLCFSGTTLPTSVLNNSLAALTKSTSSTDASGGMGCAQYYDQSITVTSTYTVTALFGGSVGFGGNLVQVTGQSNPMVDVATATKVSSASVVTATTPVTAATCQMIVTNACGNNSNPSQTITVPTGYTNLGSFNNGSTGLVNGMAMKSGAGLNSTAIGWTWNIIDSSTRLETIGTTFK